MIRGKFRRAALWGALLLLALLSPTLRFLRADEPQWKFLERKEITPVWSGHRVGFAFLAHNDALYIAFYDRDRKMTVGRRPFDAREWEFKTLPTAVGWDSHNYIAMTFDSEDYLHLSGNMHCVPLIYFRAAKPNDIASLEQVPAMVGREEKHVTYPKFLTDRSGELIFTYRDGSSGNGSQYWNVYDTASKTWRRLLDTPLFDGQGERNAYFSGPELGPDQRYHMIWVWRDTPDCATNHDLGYARSADLVHWEKSDGTPILLPIQFGGGEMIDPVPAGGGILNGLHHLAFDAETRPMVSYTKYDENGQIQLWNARREAGGWRKEQATHWDQKFVFSGGGCIVVDYRFSGLSRDSEGRFVQTWRYLPQKKEGRVTLDPETLRPIEPSPENPAPTLAEDSSAKKISSPLFDQAIAEEMDKIELDDPRVQMQKVSVSAGNRLFVFRWETLPVNRDRPPKEGAPAPATLRVFEFKK